MNNDFIFYLAAKIVTKDWTPKYFPQAREKYGCFLFFSDLPAFIIMISIIQG